MPYCIKLTEEDITSDCVILGDSHSLSVYEKGYALYRNDGKTLNGFLKEGISSFIPNRKLKVFRFYAGNIDVRHHILRLFNIWNYEQEVIRLVIELESQLQKINADKIQVVELLPIENSERKLPKTGYFEGKPFYGTVEERQQVVEFFNAQLDMMCMMNGFTFLDWPDMTNLLGELDVAYMEARQSVHLAPSSYRYKETFIR